MIFNKEIVLENDVALLRPLQESDYEHLVHFAINEPTLWIYSLVSAQGEQGMKNYISTALKKKLAKDSYPFIIYDKRMGKYAGCTRYYDFQELHKSTQLGYTWYGKEFWGTGLNKNCKLLLLSYAFETLGLDRVELRADNNNARSIAAMKSMGCTVEGILRSHVMGQDARRDSIILSILKDEWLGHAKSNLIEKISLIEY